MKWTEQVPLYILYGVDLLNNYVVIFDANFDKSFDDDFVYRFNKSFRTDKAVHEQIFDTLTPTLIRQPHGTIVSVKPILYTNLKISIPEENEWMLLVSSREYKAGSFKIDGRQYSIVAYGSPNSDYQHRTLEFLIKPVNEIYPQSDLEMPLRLKEPFYFDSTEVVLDSLSQFADTLWAKKTANQQDIKGRRVGEYAADINAVTLVNKTFSLKEHRGKYVLLDFWGSWCVPCIELIPSLRELYNQFKNRDDFLMVSIAYDKKADASKVDSIVRKMKMDWIQIIDWVEQENKIVDLYSVNTFPTTILINPQGKIVHRSSDNEGLNEIKKIIEQEISGNGTCDICQANENLLANLSLTNSNDDENAKNLAYNYQNVAFGADEFEKNFAKANKYIDTALAIWCAMNDTVEIANLLKYRGFIFAHLKRFDEGKCLIYQAIRLYEQKQNLSGVAVSLFNLSKLNELAGNYDSAIESIDKSLCYWEAKKDTSRVIMSLNQRLNLQIRTAANSKAVKTQKHIQEFLQNSGIHWRPTIDFYILSETLFERLNNKKIATEYKLKAKKLEKEIKIPDAISSSPYQPN